MTSRRDFFKRAAVVAVGALPIASLKPPVDPRDIQTIEFGNPLCTGIDRVLLNGREMKEPVTAFNVAEGWLETVDIPATKKKRAIMSTRHYGKVSYTLKGDV